MSMVSGLVSDASGYMDRVSGFGPAWAVLLQPQVRVRMIRHIILPAICFLIIVFILFCPIEDLISIDINRKYLLIF